MVPSAGSFHKFGSTFLIPDLGADNGIRVSSITGGGLRRLEKICSRLSALKPSSRLMQALIGFSFLKNGTMEMWF